jgi:WD40 repeat protein
MRPGGRARQGVFVSYARSDGEAIARALHDRLAREAPDIEAWLDRYEIEGGVGWWKQIDQELDRAEFLVLVMTPAAMRSENTRREWRSARQRGLCVYPVKAAPDAELDFAQLPSWMKKAHFYDLALEWPKLIAHLRRGCQATHVPFMAPPLPAKHVPREDVSEALTAWLLAPGRAGAVALRGAGGFGKTTLATAVCHDERVIEAFDDGILWVTLGQAPNLLNETVKLYAALTGDRPGFIDEDDAARELAGKLADKSCLIVIDDAWQAGHARRFLLGGAGCAHLVTTRLSEVAPEARSVDVDRMTPAQALALLAARSGANDLDAAHSLQLVTRLGLWPLAIKLAGSAMRQRIQRDDSPAKALDYVERALDKRGITAFDRNDADGRSDAVARTIGASLDLLDERERQRCIELAVFPEDKAIPLQAVAPLWQCDDLDCEDLARRLDELALVELDLRQGHLRVHDTLRAFMAAQLADPVKVHAGLLDAWGDPRALPYPYAWRNFAYHMRCAGRGERMHALLLDARWLSAKLAATDVHAVIGDFDTVDAAGALATVRDALRLSAPALAMDPSQWRTQLHGRLLGRREPELAGFLQSLAGASRSSWLRLLHPSLDVPGGMLRMTLAAHGRGVTSLASDARQECLVSGSADGRVKVWDRASGRLLATLPDRGLDVTAVAVSADGRRALSGGADGLIELWDIEHHERLHKLSAPDRRGVRAIAMSADASIAVSSSRAADLLVWDLHAPRLLHALRGHTESVTSVALSADGTLAVSGSDDCTVRLWDAKSAAATHTLRGHDASVNAVAVSADGSQVLSGSTDQTVKLWDAVSGACLQTLRGHDASVTAVALAGGAARGLSGASDASVKLWDLASGRDVGTLAGHSDAVRAVTMSADGRLAATASGDRTIKLWQLDRPGGALAADAHRGAVVALAFSPDGRLCASGGDDGCIKIRDAHTGSVVRSIDAHAAPIRSLAFTPDGSCVLSAGIEDKYWLWTVDTGERSWIPVSHLAPVDYAALSATARYLLTCARDGTVHLWDVPSGAGVASYGTRRLFDHLITPSPKRAAEPQDEALLDVYLAGETVYDVAIVRIDRVGRRALLSAVRRDADPAAATPAERRRAGAGDRACLLVMDIAAQGVRSLTVPQAEVISAFDCDVCGTRLLLAAADHTLELWDLSRDERVVRCRGHAGKVSAVAFLGDGRHAVSCGADRTVTLWCLASGEAKASLTADAALRSLALAPDGLTFAVGDGSGSVHLVRPELDG